MHPAMTSPLVLEESSSECVLTGAFKDIKEAHDAIFSIVRHKEKEILQLATSYKDGKIVFPRGLLKYVVDKLYSLCFELEVRKCKKLPKVSVSPDLLSDGPDPITLRDYQVMSVEKGLRRHSGIFNLATGSGKTEIAISMAKVLSGDNKYIHDSLTVVPSKSSLKQIRKRFLARGINSVGRLGGNFRELDRKHLVATASYLNSRINNKDKPVLGALRSVHLLMFDEVHHLGTAPSWVNVARTCTAPRRFGFSGSPWASGMPNIDFTDEKVSKYADFKVASLVGNTLVYVPSKMLRDMGVLVDPNIYVLPVRTPNLNGNPFPRWKSIYSRGIIQNEFRNTLITETTSYLFNRDHRVAILVVSIPHGVDLVKRLYHSGLNVAFTKGDDEVLMYNGKKMVRHSDAGETYREAFLAKDIDALIGSVVIDESVDLPGMSTLILAGGGKSPIRAVQRVGRAVRTAEGKDEAVIIDFRDKQHYFLNNHTDKRLAVYDAHEYSHIEFETVDAFWKKIQGEQG